MAFGLSPARALAGYKVGRRNIVLGYRVEEGEIVSRSLNFFTGYNLQHQHQQQQSQKYQRGGRRGQVGPLDLFCTASYVHGHGPMAHGPSPDQSSSSKSTQDHNVSGVGTGVSDEMILSKPFIILGVLFSRRCVLTQVIQS